MERNCVDINDIKETIERLIKEKFEKKDSSIEFNADDSLSERLDSMAICLLIVHLESIYNVEFPIELFCKDDTAEILAEKVHGLF